MSIFSIVLFCFACLVLVAGLHVRLAYLFEFSPTCVEHHPV